MYSQNHPKPQTQNPNRRPHPPNSMRDIYWDTNEIYYDIVNRNTNQQNNVSCLPMLQQNMPVPEPEKQELNLWTQ